MWSLLMLDRWTSFKKISTRLSTGFRISICFIASPLISDARTNTKHKMMRFNSIRTYHPESPHLISSFHICALPPPLFMGGSSSNTDLINLLLSLTSTVAWWIIKPTQAQSRCFVWLTSPGISWVEWLMNVRRLLTEGAYSVPPPICLYKW